MLTFELENWSAALQQLSTLDRSIKSPVSANFVPRPLRAYWVKQAQLGLGINTIATPFRSVNKVVLACVKIILLLFLFLYLSVPSLTSIRTFLLASGTTSVFEFWVYQQVLAVVVFCIRKVANLLRNSAKRKSSCTLAVIVERTVAVTVDGTGWGEYDLIASINLQFQKYNITI